MSERSICFATWKFHESDHGNGVPDGVRGSLKRTKNALVMHVHDITDAATNISGIQEQDTSVYLYEVAEDTCRSPSISNEQKLQPIPRTYKVHQMTIRNVGDVWYREVSCLYEEGEIHVGHEWKFARVAEKIVEENSAQKFKTTEEKSRE